MSERESIEELRTLARSIPHRPMAPERAKSVRARLLLATRTARQPAKHGWMGAAAAALVLVTAAAPWFWQHQEVDQQAEAPIQATVRPIFGLAPRRASIIEDGVRRDVVTLVSGRMEIEVEKLSAVQRFIVVTNDAEVEVRGTRFDVEAERGLLKEVLVIEGLVEVRPRERPMRLLGPGERWRPEEPVQVVPIAPPAPEVEAESPPVAKPIKRRRAGDVSVRMHVESARPHATAGELAFEEGWTAYKEGSFAAAIEAFDRALDLEPNGPLVEEAKYWRSRSETELKKKSETAFPIVR